MRWLICCVLTCAGVFLAAGRDVILATWNMKWFPSGKADIRISAEFEDFKIRRAGGMISNALASVASGSEDDVIVFVEELRDKYVCEEIVAQMKRPGMRVAAVSHYKDKAGYPIWQQSAIFSNLAVVEGGFLPWQSERYVDMPRGFVYAVLGTGSELIAAFCVHLKANVNFSGEELETQKNIYKREFASAQILEKFRELRKRYGTRLTRVAVAGDFNTNEDDETFVSEATLRAFYGAHFRSCFTGLKKSQRVTHPASGGFPDATFDYILYRGFGRGVVRNIAPGHPISDHNLVCIRLPMSD